MKLFKRIYFPVVSGLLILFILFSFLDTRGAFASSPLNIDDVRNTTKSVAGGSSRDTSIARDRTADYIENFLRSNGLNETSDILTSAGYNDATIMPSAGVNLNTFVTQTATITTAMRRDYHEEIGLDTSTLYGDTTIKNVIAILPAAMNVVNPRTVVFTANYDSVPSSYGAGDNALSVASMLETIKSLRNDQNRANNLVFVFADLGQENDLGVYAFFNRFIGFGNVASRTELVVSMGRGGNGGTVVLSDLNRTNSSVLRSVYKSGAYASSIVETFADFFAPLTNFAAVSGGFASVNLTASSGKENQNTANDITSNLSNSLIRQNSSAMYNIAAYFASNTANLDDAANDLVYFRYLGINIFYSVLAALIMTALIVGLLAAIVYFNIKVKAFSFKRVGYGALASLCSIVAAAISLFAVYCLFALIFAGYGMFNIRYFFALSYSSAGLLFAAMFAALTLTMLWSLFFKWVFNARAADMSVGNAALSALLALVAGFVVPQAAYAIVAFSTLQLTVILVTTILKKKFKEKYGFDINRLFLNLTPVLFALPLIIPAMLLASDAVGVVFYPLILIPFILAIQSVLPYFTILDKYFARIAARLPDMPRRVLKIEEKTVPNPARKGATMTVTEKRVVTQKMPVKYHHSFATVVLGIVSAILILCFSIGGNINTNFAQSANIDPFYENAFVYHLDRDEGVGNWQIKDLGIAKHILTALSDFEWDSNKGAYVKRDITNDSAAHSNAAEYVRNAATRSIIITPMDGYNSKINLSFEFFGTMPTNIKITSGDNRTIMNYALVSGDRITTLSLPVGVGTFTITFDASVNCEIFYEELNFVRTTLSSYSDWKKLNEVYAGTTTITSINPRMKITRTLNIDMI